MVGTRGRRSGTGLGVCGLHGALSEGVSVGVARLLEALFSLSPVTSGEVRQHDKRTRERLGLVKGVHGTWKIAFGEINSQVNFSLVVLVNSVKRSMVSLFVSIDMLSSP